jgi:hypothetical protein
MLRLTQIRGTPSSLFGARDARSGGLGNSVKGSRFPKSMAEIDHETWRP